MRKMLAAFALLGLMTIVAVEANAQRPGGGFGGGFLIMNKGVQEELKCTDEQKEKIAEKMKASFERQKEIFTKLKDTPKEEFREKMQAMQKEMNAETQKELDAILKPEQSKRLKQIERQQNVLTTLTKDEEVVKELKISDEQKEKLKGINEDVAKDMSELRKGFKDNPKETGEKITALRKEGTEKAVKVLTSEQSDKWKEIVGAPFEVKFEGGGFRPKAK